MRSVVGRQTGFSIFIALCREDREVQKGFVSPSRTPGVYSVDSYTLIYISLGIKRLAESRRR